MAADGRCACGSRIFYDLGTRITCDDGRAFTIPGVQISVCVNCESRVAILGKDGERKAVVRFGSGPKAEKELFLAALNGWKTDHDKAPNDNLLTATEADQKDFERHGIPLPEAAQK